LLCELLGPLGSVIQDRDGELGGPRAPVQDVEAVVDPIHAFAQIGPHVPDLVSEKTAQVSELQLQLVLCHRLDLVKRKSRTLSPYW
jgi:hypothetical protein